MPIYEYAYRSCERRFETVHRPSEDALEEDGAVSVYTVPEDFGPVVDALRGGGFEPAHAEVAMLPTTTSLCDDDTAAKVLRLIDALDDLDDVQNVYSNAEFPDGALAD